MSGTTGLLSIEGQKAQKPQMGADIVTKRSSGGPKDLEPWMNPLDSGMDTD